jgi:hypothetical protein
MKKKGKIIMLSQFERDFLEDIVKKCPLELKDFYYSVPISEETEEAAILRFGFERTILMKNPEIKEFFDYLMEKYDLNNSEKLNFIASWIDKSFADDETRVWTEKLNEYFQEYNGIVGLLLPVRAFIDMNFPIKFMFKLTGEEKEIIDFLLFEGNIDEAKTKFNDIYFEAFERKLLEEVGETSLNQALYLAFVFKNTEKENLDYLAHFTLYQCVGLYIKLRDYELKTEDEKKHFENIVDCIKSSFLEKVLVDENLEAGIQNKRLLLNLFISENIPENQLKDSNNCILGDLQKYEESIEFFHTNIL